jgi:hypothetical protein
MAGQGKDFSTNKKEKIMEQAAQERMIYPAWKNAVELAAIEFKTGDLITMAWIHKNFMIKKPTTGTFETFQKYQFEFLAAIDGFKNELLEIHQIAIANVRGEGYRILHPKKQTEHAEKKFIDDLKKNVNKAITILTNIKYDQLDDKDRKDNADTKCRIAAIYTMSKKQKLLTA